MCIYHYHIVCSILVHDPRVCVCVHTYTIFLYVVCICMYIYISYVCMYMYIYIYNIYIYIYLFIYIYLSIYLCECAKYGLLPMHREAVIGPKHGSERVYGSESVCSLRASNQRVARLGTPISSPKPRGLGFRVCWNMEPLQLPKPSGESMIRTRENDTWPAERPRWLTASGCKGLEHTNIGSEFRVQASLVAVCVAADEELCGSARALTRFQSYFTG